MSEKCEVILKNGRINFSCKMDNCGNSCCGPFAGVSVHLDNIENRPFDHIVLTPEDIKRLESKARVEWIVEEKCKELKNPDGTAKTYRRMALEEDGTCKAFKNGKCSINDIKPTVCIAFPFYFDMFSGLCAIRCEGFSEEYWSDISNFKGCFEAAKKMYDFWTQFYSDFGKE